MRVLAFARDKIKIIFTFATPYLQANNRTCFDPTLYGYNYSSMVNPS